MDKPPEDFSLLAQVITAMTAILSGFWAYINRNAKHARESIDVIQKQVNEIDKRTDRTETIMSETKHRIERIENKIDKISDRYE